MLSPPQGTGSALRAKVDDLLTNIAVLEHRPHARLRIYPRVAGTTITLISDGVADTYGAWTEIIPLNGVDFAYECRGIVIYGVDVASTYFFQLGCSITGDDPTSAQILGEREIKLIDVPIATATEPLEFDCPECPANAKLWGRLKTDGGDTDEAYISVLVARHVQITNPIDHLATWPWST